jgi:uncharacterized membrane protein YcaP (DUF421 family)
MDAYLQPPLVYKKEKGMDPQQLLLTAVRATIIYFFLLLVVRILGKREVGTITAFDLIVSLMLGEVVDEAIFGDVSMAQAGVAIGSVAFWHLANSWASFKSDFIHKLTGDKPRVLIESGELLQDALAKERLNEQEIFSELRMQGIDDIQEVKTATLETNGRISVVQEEWAKPIQKGDLPGKSNGKPKKPVSTPKAKAGEKKDKPAKKKEKK